ncbi:MAG: RNA polymerase sigma factor [Myxococcaceae bacterium]
MRVRCDEDPGSVPLGSSSSSLPVTGQAEETCAAGPDDWSLAGRAFAGDRAALHALYQRHGDFVFRAALRHLGDEDEARDVVQDVFAGLFGRARAYTAQGRFTTLLWRVVANRCLNERARPHRRDRARGIADEEEALAAPAAAEEQPDRQLERRQTREAVRAAILSLPERQRLALVLSRYEGLSYEEIAQALSCSVSSVESLLFRARQNLLPKLVPD